MVLELLHFPLVLMSRLNKTESAVFYYTYGLAVLGHVRVVALSNSSHEQTQ